MWEIKITFIQGLVKCFKSPVHPNSPKKKKKKTYNDISILKWVKEAKIDIIVYYWNISILFIDIDIGFYNQTQYLYKVRAYINHPF